jgi:hypothetical protein
LIPQFDEHGYLPPDVHTATLKEVVARFGQGSEQREAQALQWLLPLCRAAGITKLLIAMAASSRTRRSRTMLIASPCRGLTTAPIHSLPQVRQSLPFVELNVVSESDYQLFRDVLFASDRAMIDKGVIEVLV